MEDQGLGIRRQDPVQVGRMLLLFRHNPVGLHVTQELVRDFSQNLFGQVEPGYLRVDPSSEKIPERNKLDNVAGSHSAIR